MGSIGTKNSSLKLIKSKLSNINDYTGYAYELATLNQGDEVYQIQYNGGKGIC